MSNNINMIKKGTNHEETRLSLDKIENETNLSIVNLEKERIDNTNITLIVYEKFFFRVASYVSVSVLIINSNKQTKVSIVGSGGGYTPLNVDFGANNKIKRIVIEIFEELGYEKY